VGITLSNIRVTYSGLISLAVGISSVFTGTVFTIIVTRSLTPEEFGTWGLIGGLLFYVLIAEPIISYWSTREIARGVSSGSTSLVSSGLFSIGGVSVYIIIAYFVGSQSDANVETLTFAAMLIPVMFLNKTLTAINIGWKPELVSYGLLAFEIAKIPSALILVYYLNFGIEGAIIATTVSYIISIIVLAIGGRKKIKTKINFQFLKRWIKLSWLPLYPGMGSLIFTLDVAIFSIITGSVAGIAYYSSALAIAAFVAHSGAISRAIYPKLLGGGKTKYLEENLHRFFFFGFPFLALSIILARPGLYTLNPLYEIAVPVVIFLTMRAFLYTFSGILNQALQGIETVDMDKKANFKSFIKSKLFLMPTLVLIKYSAYTISLTLVFILAKDATLIELVIYWSIISFIVEIPFFIYLTILSKKYFNLKNPIKNSWKYIISCVIVFGITYYVMEKSLIYVNKVFEFLPNVLLFVLIGAGGYLLLTYVIDHRTRILVSSIINEIRGR